MRLHDGIIDLTPQDAGAAAGGKHQAHQQFESSGFPGAVRSQIAEDFAFIDRQLQWAQGGLGLLSPEADGVNFLEAQDFDGRHLLLTLTLK